MNESYSQLSLTELCDKLSECTTVYSKSLLNGINEKEFSALRALMEALQKEITKRKAAESTATDGSLSKFPPQPSQ